MFRRWVGGDRLELNEIKKSSAKLAALELSVRFDNIDIRALWFRAAEKKSIWHIKKHKHSSYEFHFVSEGDSKVVLEDGSFIVSKGQFFITPPSVYHAQENGLTDYYLEYCLNIDIKRIGPADNALQLDIIDLLRHAPCAAFNDSLSIGRVFENALRDAAEQKPGYVEQIKLYIMQILLLSARIIDEHIGEKNHPQVKTKRDDVRFGLIEKYIRDNISSKITPQSISKYLRLSERQIYRIIKAKLGLSTSEFINELKYERAKLLLRDTDYSIKQISEMTGFSSQYYFSSFFKQRKGVSPVNFRKKNE